jgi:hypothetical protein
VGGSDQGERSACGLTRTQGRALSATRKASLSARARPLPSGLGTHPRS